MFQFVYLLPLFLCTLLQVQATLPPILEQLHPLHPAPISPHYHVPEEQYLPNHHHLPPPPPPSLQHTAPLVHEVKPLPVERSPVDPSRCALIVPDHRPPAHSYINSNYLGRSKRSIPYGPYSSPSVPVTPHTEANNLCITYDDVNSAILQAKAKSGGFIPQEIYELSSEFPKPAHVGVPAAIIEEATRILAHRFGLSKQTLLYLLPRIDTSRTAARDICPTFLLPVKCELSKYRTLTGMCNNLNYPSWGATRTAMIRMLPPDYADGIAAPRRAYDGSPLPSPRRVSFVLHQDITHPDAHVSYLTVAFGQTLDHDLTFAPITRDPFGNEIECCGKSQHERHPACLPLDLPKDDPFFKFFKRTCMEFSRIIPSLKANCPLGPRGQSNQISAYIDGNFVYGSSQERANGLREKKGGRMKTTPMWKHLGLKDLLPMNTAEPDKGCERKGHPRNSFCFDAGDERVNEQLPLTVTHTIFLREHNRIADYLAASYPYWDDEKIYQETRRIVVAQIQHITFNEWLPVILGRKIMGAYGLDLVTDGYFNGYDEKANSAIRVAFQAAAFRFGHSILPDVIERYNKYHQKIEAIRLSVLLRQPFDMYKPGAVDTYILGLLNQEAARMDADITTEVTNHLFERPGSHFGRDLAAINVQRGRELGVPGYNAFREYCGLNRVKDWYELAGSFDNRTLHRMQLLYKHVDDIDLFSAGIAEYPLPGALLGPVFSCIIAEQFANTRKGDRFWYENYGQFTPEQLYELRKVKMARLVCENSDDVETIQLYPFLTADPHTNPRVACHDLPAMDLSRFVNEPHPQGHPSSPLYDNHLKSGAAAAASSGAAAAASSAKAAASS